MSSASFEPYSTVEMRRSSAGISQSMYDAQSSSSARRRSPSPGPSFRRYGPYDSYIPRGGPPYRDEFHNNYRPNNYRPGRSYYSRSPSPPDRYEGPRPSDPDPWARSSNWQPPRTDRRPHSPPPPSWDRDRGRREIMAERMFEPSDSRKQPNNDRPGRQDVPTPSPSDRWFDPRVRPGRDLTPTPPPPVDRWCDHRVRPGRDITPPRPAPRHDWPPRLASDSYRPHSGSHQPHRDSYPVSRSDTYRPTYEDGGPWRATHPHDSPPVKISHKRDSSPPNQHPHNFASTYDNGNARLDTPLRSTNIVSPRRFPHLPPSRTGIAEPMRPPPLMDQRHHNMQFRPRSRGSSISDEPPFKKFKSRSSSHCSDLSQTLKSDILSARSKFDMIRQPLPTVPSIFQSFSYQTKLEERRSPQRNYDILAPSTGVASSPVAQPTISSGHETDSLPPPRTSSLPTPPQDSFHNDIALPSESPINSNIFVPIITDTPFDDLYKTQVADQHTTPHKSQPEETMALSPVPSETTVGTSSKLPDVDYAQQHAAPPVLTLLATSRDTTREPSSTEEPSLAPDFAESARADSHNSRRNQTAAADVMQPSEIPRDLGPVGSIREPSKLEAKSINEALRVIVRARLLQDNQTRDERVLPVLRANHALVKLSSNSSTSPDALIHEVVDTRLQEVMEVHTKVESYLFQGFKERQSYVAEKTQKLREEYLTLHESWLAHCTRLDNAQNKNGTPEESVVASGRSTRRSAAILGDAVRSDLEMEQIIASLGVEELTDPNHLAIKNVAKIPDMISVTEGSVTHLYDDTNNQIDNPTEFYSSPLEMDDWTEEEKTTFSAKFAAQPKQFGLIADHLPHKTAAQCITYYYLHKKGRVDFRKVVAQHGPGKRRKGGKRTDKRKGNALLADIRQHDAEVSRDSSSGANGGNKRKRSNLTEESKRATSRRIIVQSEQIPTSGASTPDPESNLTKKKRRGPAPARAATVNGVSEGNEDVTVVQDQNSERKATRKPRGSRKAKVQPPTPSEEPVPNAEAQKCTDQNETTTRRRAATGNVHWSDEDKSVFLTLLAQHGDDFKRIAASMPNKTTIQVSNYYKSNVHDLDLEKVAACAPKRSPTPELSRDSWKDGAHFPGSGIMSPIAGSGSPHRLHSTEPNGITPAADKPWLENESMFSVQSCTNGLSSSATGGSPQPHSPLLPRTHPPSNFTRFVPQSLSLGGNDINLDTTISQPLSFVPGLPLTFSYTHQPDTQYSGNDSAMVVLAKDALPGGLSKFKLQEDVMHRLPSTSDFLH